MTDQFGAILAGSVILPSNQVVVLTLLQISDLHFGPPYLPDVGGAVLRLAHELGPDAIVICGDLTQRAKREQFAQARAFLDRLPPVPRIVVPGNHDVPLYRIVERWRDPHGLYRKHIHDELDHVQRLKMPRSAPSDCSKSWWRRVLGQRFAARVPHLRVRHPGRASLGSRSAPRHDCRKPRP